MAIPRNANAEWLTVFQLPTYAPDLNPQEGTWSLVKRDIGNLTTADLSQITRAVKHRLKTIQYRPHLIDGCLAGTGLTLDSCASDHRLRTILASSVLVTPTTPADGLMNGKAQSPGRRPTL